MSVEKLYIKHFLSFGWLLAIFFIFSYQSLGQEAGVELKPESIRIGEHAEISINVEAPAEAHIMFPIFSDTIHTNIDIVRYGTIDSSYTDDGSLRILSQTYTITSFEEGHFPIKPIEFKSIIDNDTTVFHSEPLLLSVETIDVDIEADIKDIKSIINIPYTFREIFPYILLVILIAATILLIIIYLKKRKQKPLPQSEWKRPDVPAHVAALNNLESLRKKNYLKEEKFKQFHSELTDILRRYLEKRFNIDAPEMTTDEILKNTKNIINEHENSLLKEILVLSDLVKFAKHKPLVNESEKLLKDAFELVRNTIEETSETDEK